jgi:hypothetical protein
MVSQAPENQRYIQLGFCRNQAVTSISAASSSGKCQPEDRTNGSRLEQGRGYTEDARGLPT